MGVACAAVINTFVDRLINPFIALLLPGIDRLAGLGTFGANGSVGAVLGAVINFLVVAWILFLVVRAYNRMQDRREESQAEAPPSEEVTLLTEISRFAPLPLTKDSRRYGWAHLELSLLTYYHSMHGSWHSTS